MDHSEGRNDPFTVLRTYLKHPPKVIIYDFACALEEYCMNRDPTWFRNTKFVIDRFHWRNHTRYARANAAVLSHCLQLRQSIQYVELPCAVQLQQLNLRTISFFHSTIQSCRNLNEDGKLYALDATVGKRVELRQSDADSSSLCSGCWLSVCDVRFAYILTYIYLEFWHTYVKECVCSLSHRVNVAASNKHEGLFDFRVRRSCRCARDIV
jgi:hypothetical protein